MNSRRGLLWSTLACLVALALPLVLHVLGLPGHIRQQLPVVEPRHCDLQQFSDSLPRFSKFIQFPSVSNASAPDHTSVPEVLEEMTQWLEASYPVVWEKLEVEKVGSQGFSRLLTWHGSESSLSPVLFISHYDVVPVTPGTEQDWTHPPFSGKIVDEYVWGRGTADIKFSVVALLEAVTHLLAAGYSPRRTLMFAFGHDEEVGGELGAGQASALLASRGTVLDMIIDEGGLMMLDGMKPFVKTPVALVGTAEKGYTSAKVTLSSPGGHASMPPTDGSDVWSGMGALQRGLRARPLGLRLQAPMTDLLHALQPYSAAPLKYLMASADKWPLNILIANIFRHLGRETAALVQTTVAMTRVSAGVADNVLPQEATLNFNTRTLPGTSPQDVAAHFQSVAEAAKIMNAKVELVKATVWPASNVTDWHGRHFGLLRQAIQETWDFDGQPPAVAPFLLCGGTDSKHYGHLSKHGIMRFVPYALNKTAGELGLIHGTNERIRSADLLRAICTYQRVLQLFGDMDNASSTGGK